MWLGDQEIRTLTAWKGLLCGEDIRSFYIIPYLWPEWPILLGTGQGQGERTHASIREGWAWVTVQLVVSDLHWPHGKNDLSHSLAFCHNLPAKASCLAQLTGPGSFIGWEGGRAQQEQRTQQTSPGWLSFPQHRAWLAVTVPQPVLAQALTAPASRAVQAVPWSCVVACRH